MLAGQAYLVKNLHVIAILASASGLLYTRRREGLNESHLPLRGLSLPKIMTAFTIFSIGVMPVLIARAFTPFPMTEAGTFTKPVFSIQLPLRMMNKGYLEPEGHWVDFLPVALVCSIFSIDPSSFLWSAPFLLTTFYAIYTYLFIKKISNDRSISLLAAAFAVFINIYFAMPGQMISHYKSNHILQAFFPSVLYMLHSKLEREKYEVKDGIKSAIFLFTIILVFCVAWEMLLTRRFFSLDVLLGFPPGFRIQYRYLQPLAILFPPLLGFLIGANSKSKFLKDLSGPIFFISIIFYFFHHQEFILFVTFIFVYVLLYYVTKNKTGRVIVCLFSIFCFFYIYLQHIGILRIYSTNPLTSLLFSDAGYTGYTFDIKYYIIEKANTSVMLLFSVFGGIFAVFSERREHKILLGLYSFAMLTYFSPEWYSVRVIHSVLSPAMAFIIALAIFSIAETTSKRLNWRKATVLISNKTVILALLLMILMPSGLYSVMETYSFINPNYEYFTEMKRYEWDAGFWLRENTAETERIISDYRTMLNLNPLTQKIWLTPIGMYGPSLDWNAVYNSNGTNLLKFIKDEIFQAPLLNRKQVDTSSIEVIYDDYEENFWCPIAWGSGTHQLPVVSNETTEKTSKIDSLKIVFSSTGGTYIGARVYHQFPAPRDWSDKDFLAFDWYGQNTSNYFAIYCFTSDGVYFYEHIKDDWIGWKTVIMSLRDMRTVESPTWKSISQIGIQQLDIEGTFYLDHMIVGNFIKPSSEHAYRAIMALKRVIPWHESYYLDYCRINETEFEFLVVITPRTWQWIMQEGYEDVGSILYTSVSTEYLKMFKDSRYFEEIYCLNNQVYVFRVKEEIKTT
jgi:hypothetical protein